MIVYLLYEQIKDKLRFIMVLSSVGMERDNAT